MTKKLIVATLGALASTFIVANGSIKAATLPCEPALEAARPVAPTGLRILRPGEAVVTEAPASLVAVPTAPIASSSGTHAYFERLASMRECMVAYSLRSQEQLNAYMDQPDPTRRPTDITFSPAADPDSRRQDAAKIVIPANEPSLPNNVRLPIPPVGGDSLLVTWESWMGREFDSDMTGIGGNKHFQFTSPKRIWTEVKADFDWGKKLGGLAVATVRSYGQEGDLGPEVTIQNPLSPMSATFVIKPETWTRYWVYFKPAGEWHEFSMWLADETRDPVLVLDGLRMKPNYALGATGWETFWIEYNTSGKGLPEGFGSRVAYARNVVMLRGVTDPRGILERPVK